MSIVFRARADLVDMVRQDLRRRHPFAFERVGFFKCRAGRLAGDGLISLAAAYDPVSDDDYLRHSRVGAMMGPGAIRQAMQLAHNGGAEDVSVFHVHLHMHSGMPSFSRIDLSESQKFVPDFFTLAPSMPHGAIVLSLDRAVGLCWTAQDRPPAAIDRFEIVGAPLLAWGMGDE